MTAKRVDDTILKLVEQVSHNTGVQDHIAKAMKDSTNPRLAFCNWMGLELCVLDEDLWSNFTSDAFQLVQRYKGLSRGQHTPTAPPQPPQHQPPAPPPAPPVH